MAEPPRPDKLPGPVRYKPPSGKPEDRPLEKIRQEYETHRKAQKGDDGSDNERDAMLRRHQVPPQSTDE